MFVAIAKVTEMSPILIAVGSGSSGNARKSKKVDCLNVVGGISDAEDLGSPEQEQEAIQVCFGADILCELIRCGFGRQR